MSTLTVRKRERRQDAYDLAPFRFSLLRGRAGKPTKSGLSTHHPVSSTSHRSTCSEKREICRDRKEIHWLPGAGRQEPGLTANGHE